MMIAGIMSNHFSSWLTYFFQTHFHIEEGRLGTIFLVSSLVTAASMLAAASLARRFGNVNVSTQPLVIGLPTDSHQTMVATHLPSSILLSVIPLFNELTWSLVFLILRACTQSMDTPPRAAFLAMVILPEERTAVMGTINVIRTLSQTLGPLITGILADRDLLWVSFVVAGALKVLYDLGFLMTFKGKEMAGQRTQNPSILDSQHDSSIET